MSARRSRSCGAVLDHIAGRARVNLRTQRLSRRYVPNGEYSTQARATGNSPTLHVERNPALALSLVHGLKSSRRGGGMRKLDYAILKAIGRLLRRQGDDILTAPHPPQIGKLLSRLEQSEGAGAGDEVRAWVLAHRDEAGPGQARPRIKHIRPAYRRRRWRRRRPSASAGQYGRDA